MVRVLKILLILYQKFLGPFIGSHCRFFPSCSNYALEAIEKHGVFFGLFLALKRLIRCNQFFPGGFDPVP